MKNIILWQSVYVHGYSGRFMGYSFNAHFGVLLI